MNFKKLFTTENKIIFVVVLFFLLSMLLIVYFSKNSVLYSRTVMQQAESLIAEDMSISPPEASRFYAYIATVYFEILQKEKRSDLAILASTKIMEQVYPKESYPVQARMIERFKTKIVLDPNLKLSNESEIFLQQILVDEEKDRKVKVKVVPPQGEKYWSGNTPEGINSLVWKPWIIDKDYTAEVENPPQENSKEQQEGLDQVIKLSNSRTLENNAWINFWSAMHMTPSLSGVWQDRLAVITKPYQLKDQEYAYAQMVLAQSLSDTFQEVWKIKYKYWTKRPSTYTNKIKMSMEDPSYPGFVSEYPAVAKTAYTVLSELFPAGQEVLAKDLRNSSFIGSRAGCAFPYDEVTGEKLGSLISKDISEKMQLAPIRKDSLIPLSIFSPDLKISPQYR